MFRVRRTLLAAGVAVGVVSGPVALSEARAGATATLPASLSGTALPGEVVSFLGSATVAERPVDLQVRVGKKWQKVASTHTDAAGQFAFPITVGTDPTQYRARVLDYTVAEHEYAPANSDALTVTPQPSTGELSLGVAPIAQSPSGTKDLTPGTATFSPLRPGAPVRIQRHTSDGWVDVATGTQDGTGAFHFAVKATGSDGPYTFRAISTPTATDEIVTAESRSANWQLSFADDFDSDGADSAFHSVGPNGHGGKRTCSIVDGEQTGSTGQALTLHVNVDAAGVPDGCDLDSGTVDASLSTQDTQAFTYGMFAARIKYQDAPGQHGADRKSVV